MRVVQPAPLLAAPPAPQLASPPAPQHHMLTHKPIARPSAPAVELPKAPSVDHGSLIDFCNAALVKLNQAEEQIKANYQSTIAALDEKIRTLETQLELSKLRETRLQQEVQDLHLLLQMVEQPQNFTQPT